MKILTTDQMRQAEQGCVQSGISMDMLMENAGKAVAEEVRSILDTIDRQHILVLIGPGNNGGDGLVAARHLHDWGARVSIYLCNQRPSTDPNLQLVQQRGLDCIEATHDEGLNRLNELLSSADTVIDAIFGTGKVRPLQGTLRQVLEMLSQVRGERPTLCIVAVDLPSGLNADTGAVDEVSPYADHTITLGMPKLGLFNLPGAVRAGKITIADIGIPSYLVEDTTTELVTDQWARAALPQRPLQANKGTFGRVLAIAGSINYIGAAYLACSGAMRVGAGLVTLAPPSSLQPILAAKLAEVTYIPLPESHPGIISTRAAELIEPELGSCQALLLGCGLGQNESTTALIRSLLLESKKAMPPLVLDADALNTLATIPKWWQQLTTDAILTPHPGEMARLTGTSVEEVQQDRAGISQRMASEWRKTIVLKGAYSVIAAPDGQTRISPITNPGLASAGTGDVLAGAIAGLAAQGLSPFDAATLGVYLHGQAGEMVKAEIGDTGMIASDLLLALPPTIKKLRKRDSATKLKEPN